MEERKITAALKVEASQVRLPDGLLERIAREGASAGAVRPGFWSRLRLGSALEFALACVVMAALLGVVAWRDLDPVRNQPAGSSFEQALAALREQVAFPIFVPTAVPDGLAPQPPMAPSEGRAAVTMEYRTDDGSVGLRVTNGPAGCCLDADPTKAVGATSIRNGITAYFLVNQPESGGPILWWQEGGTYVALSGPRLTKEQLVAIANSMSSVPPLEAARLETLPSAAAPGVSGPSSLDTAQLLGRAIEAVSALELPAAAVNVEFHTEDPDYVFICAHSPGGAGEEVEMLACRFGEFVNSVTGHALFWNVGGEWEGSLYPQVSDEVARSRQAYFRSLGENCPIGCAGGFKALRQEGNRVLAVVDLSSVGTHATDEVHLLEREQRTGAWRIVWVPTPDRYRFEEWPSVTLPEQGIERFVVTYRGGEQETWVYTGAGFEPE